MSLITKFDTPASLRDVPTTTMFYEHWHETIKSMIKRESAGERGGAFYNPALVDVDVAGEKTMTWMGFPRRILLPENRDDKVNAYKIADAIRSTPDHPQDEYFEWFVHTGAGKKITKVTFVTELPLYYQELWNFSSDTRAALVRIYKKHVSPLVTEADLQNSDGSYNIFNDWNTNKGILHYNQSINNLSAAIGLAEDLVVSSLPSTDNYDAMPRYGDAGTSVDPRVSYDVHMLVRKGLFATLADPVGLYIVGWDNSGITKPDGRPAPASWWKCKRGKAGMVLRLEYEVPKGQGFVVGDLRLGGHRIEYGGQLAEHITVGLGGLAGTKK